MTIVFRCGTSFKIFSCNITAFSQYKNSSWKPWIDTQLCYYDRTPLITVLLHWRAILYKYSLLLLLLLTPYKPLGEQGMAQWWQRLPPTNVAQVQIPASTPYVGWVCSWFSPLLQEVFLWVLQFSPLIKNRHFQIPIWPGIR